MKRYNLIALLIVFALSGMNLSAQTDIISPQDFMALKKADKELIIVDANKPSNYEANHIKGAINIYHNDMYQDGDIAGVLLEPTELAVFFAEKGINENSKVVIYDDGSQKYNTRVYWALKYIGATDVQLMHKNLDECRRARVPLTATPATLETTTFTPTVDESIYASMEYVMDNKDKEGVMLIDCRTADEYNGVKKSEGHLPGAININYEELLTENGAFKTTEELQAIAESYGITPDTELLLYCRTSVRAAVAFVAFKNILGYENIRVYDGAYLEWVANHPVQ